MASRDNPARPAPAPTVAPGTAASVGVGRVLGGRYRLEQKLAQGGMGTVFRATQLALGRHVAIKVLRADYQVRRPRDFYRRFAVEARAAARLQHPHSVTVLDYGCEADGTYYLVMEYLRGKTLAQLLADVGPMDLSRAVGIALQVGRAVQAAHATGIVHRDLKPANVMVLDWGEDAANARADFVKVLDFGLAKQFGAATELLTRTGQFLGSPGYMAPEQITGAELDGRCDVYALGAVLYQMLAGRPPFFRASPHEVMRAHLNDAVPPLWPEGPGGVTVAMDVEAFERLAAQQQRLEAVVRRALAKRPDARFASMGKLLEALHHALGEGDALPSGATAGDAAIATVGQAPDGDFTVARATLPAPAAQAATLFAGPGRGEDTVWLRPQPEEAKPSLPCEGGDVGAGRAPRLEVGERPALKLPLARAERPRQRWRRLGRGASAWLGVALWFALGQAPSLGMPGRPLGFVDPQPKFEPSQRPASLEVALVPPPPAPATRRNASAALAQKVASAERASSLEGAAEAEALAPVGCSTSVVGRGVVPDAYEVTGGTKDVGAEPMTGDVSTGAEPSAPHAPSLVLHLDSTPRGAAVFVAGERICVATPCATTLAVPERRVQLRFSLAGHDDTLVARRVPAVEDVVLSPRGLAVHATMR